MRRIKNLLVVLLFCLPISGTFADTGNYVTCSQADSGFELAASGKSAQICMASDDWKGVIRAAHDLAEDIGRVTGVSSEVKILSAQNSFKGKQALSIAPKTVVVGTLGKSSLIDALVKKGKVKVNDIRGQWESYIIQSDGQNLYVVGSDKRGTIYGLYDISEKIGVSPWYWWADVPAKRASSLYIIKGRYMQPSPKVKYRGIFINDEFPSMTAWARNKFGGMNSKMYAHMFELLLRLKANCLWPAMWGSFKEYKPLVPILKDKNGRYEGNCFNEDDLENPRLADEYGIVMGTSHHEPMMRSQQEWIRHKQNYGNAEWNWQTNKEAISRFFTEGMQNAKNYENLVTIGMRGDEDRPMVDAGSREANFRQMEEIMAAQRKMIAKTTGKPASETPQVWTLYSEVLDYYDQGLKVPDDVIIMLCDDNFGHVRRLPYLGTEKHKGGYGMYYHVGYYGAPRASKWLTMSTITEMWEQLQATYQYGVDKFWILNVGDLKPHEFSIDFFLKMAWEPNRYDADNLRDYAEQFCAGQFGETDAADIADLLLAYGRYASRITAEMLDDQTYNLHSGEFKSVRDEFLVLEAKALRIYQVMDEAKKDAYEELVLFPIQGMANLYDMYYSLAMNKHLYAEGDAEANRWADQVEKCFVRDSLLCRHYNQEIAGGKWNHMMDQVHIGYTEWHAPRYNVMPKVYRLSDEEGKNARQSLRKGYVFTEEANVVSIEAQHVADYQNAVADTQNPQNGDGAAWRVIPGLGRTLSGIVLYPYTQPVTGAYIDYQMQLNTRQDSVDVYLTVAAVMPFLKGGHQVAVSLDGGKEEIINLNQNLNWEHKYDLMYPTAASRVIEKKVRLAVGKASVHTLRFRPLQPGIVFEKVQVDGGGYRPSRLGMPESPYWYF